MRVFWLTLLLTIQNVCYADIVVIVNVKNKTTQLNINEVRRIFLGKKVKFNDGDRITVVLPKSGEARIKFLNSVIRKNPSQFQAYWSKIVFTGKSRAPKVINSDKVVDFVANHPNCISFVDRSATNNKVKIITVIK